MGHNLDRAHPLWAGMRARPEVDRSPLAALTTDPLVMEYLPGTLRADQCDTLRVTASNDMPEGDGWWAGQVKATGAFIGASGRAGKRLCSWRARRGGLLPDDAQPGVTANVMQAIAMT